MILILVVLNSYVLYVVGARIGLGIDLQSLPLVLAGVAIGKSNRKAFRSRLAHVTQVRQYEYQREYYANTREWSSEFEREYGLW
jgi:hypothetical protein